MGADGPWRGLPLGGVRWKLPLGKPTIRPKDYCQAWPLTGSPGQGLTVAGGSFARSFAGGADADCSFSKPSRRYAFMQFAIAQSVRFGMTPGEHSRLARAAQEHQKCH